jgi:hypothetical protein
MLLKRQSDAIIASGLKSLELEGDTVQGPSRSKEANGQQVESVEVMHRQFERQETGK